MRLVAIYIDEHEYLFKKPQTINFGGQYSYNFEKVDEIVYVKRERNEEYIEGFFDITKLDSKLISVNALVGQNGSGKSTIFDIIRSMFIDNPFALPHSNPYLLFEMDNYYNLEVVSSIYDIADVNLKIISNQEDFVIKSSKRNYQTIYYSPHFDFKYNPNFDNTDNYDISFDKLLEEDLEDLENKKPYSSGWNYKPNQELVFKNSIRQILFLSSDLVKKDNIFKDIFNFPKFGEAKLFIRGHKEIKEWNTPSSFRPALTIIKRKLQKEIDNWTTVRKFKDQSRVSNQIDINKYLLKRYIIRDIMTVLERQMEKQNTYLSEGEFEYENFEKDSSREDAYNTFLIFIKKSQLKFGEESVSAFEYEIIKKLIDKLYSSIDKINLENNVQNEMLVVNSADAIEILTLQRNFINNLFHYYTLFYEDTKNKLFEKSDKIDGFINYMPNTKLSSGENALLNLFSRLYDFLNSKLSNETRLLKNTDNYILLLDEADLGFHPTWKKKFVSSIISTIPHFFNSLENNPNVQILFSTHDPLTLSDMPNKNIIYLKRNIANEETEILDFDNPKRPKKSFAANVTELLADSFFIEDGLIGDFANKKINETIFWLNEKENKSVYEYHKKVIQNIDEPIIQRKLAEMYSEKMKENLSEELLQKEIDVLTERLKKIKRK